MARMPHAKLCGVAGTSPNSGPSGADALDVPARDARHDMKRPAGTHKRSQREQMARDPYRPIWGITACRAAVHGVTGARLLVYKYARGPRGMKLREENVIPGGAASLLELAMCACK
jgi:hypothetical protein